MKSLFGQPHARNLVVLALSMALVASGAPLVVLTGGIVGDALAPSPGLATLPIAAFIVGTAITSIPAALLMQRVGRRLGFAFGSAVGAAACALAVQALRAESFPLFVAATSLLGGSAAFVQQYRFAAIESVPAEYSGQAVSAVMLGGVVAGFLGPQIVRGTRDLLPTEYAASFLVVAALYVAVALVMLLALREVSVGAAANASGRPLREIAAQPSYRTAVAAAAMASGVMVLVMTATPVSMHVMDGHSVDATATVITSHMVAMFLPSVVSGFLVTRIGTAWLMRGGLIALTITVVAGLVSHSLLSYGVGLVLLGVGWNLLFLSATVQLTRSYRVEERFRAQALNDFVIFTIQATAALAAGAVLHRAGWGNHRADRAGRNCAIILSAARAAPVSVRPDPRSGYRRCNRGEITGVRATGSLLGSHEEMIK